jgi:hypothetical protein
MTRIRAILVGAGFALVACNRYEYVAPGCPPPAAPVLRVQSDTLSVQAAERRPAFGRVRDTESGEPLLGARIEWQAQSVASNGPAAVRSATGRADANGIFHLDSLPVGARGEAVIRVRYLGYDSVDQLVRAPQLGATQLLGSHSFLH